MITAISLSILALLIAAYLITKGWRLSFARALWRDFDFYPIFIGFAIGGYTIFFIGVGNRHIAGRGGYEGGGYAVTMFYFINFEFWRDPYRSKNSSEYLTDKIYDDKSMTLEQVEERRGRWF